MNWRHITALALALAVFATPIGAASALPEEVNPARNPNVDARYPDVITISNGHDSGLLKPLPDGEFSIDPTEGGEVGLNTNAKFTYGDADAPATRPAFVITNTDDKRHDLIIRFRAPQSPPSIENVRFLLHDRFGRRLGVASEESLAIVIPNVESGESIYVIVIIDTRGLSLKTNLTGRFTVSVIGE